MLSFKEFLDEKVLNIGFNPKHEKHREKYRGQIHDILQKSYVGVKGGYGGHGSGTEAESKAIHADISQHNIKATKRGDTITHATLYKSSHGRKIIGLGRKGDDQGKKDLEKNITTDKKLKRAWGEFSQPAEKTYRHHGFVQRSSARASRLVDKPDIEVKNKKYYTRSIGGKKHTKTILGYPQKD